MSTEYQPSHPPNPRVTGLLQRAQSGDQQAVEELLPLVYHEMRQLAQAVFRHQNPNHTLQPTALVHEAYLKLVGNLEGVEGKRHFFLIAGRAMRQILTDHARAKASGKRGGGAERLTLIPDLAPSPAPALDLVALDESLKRLEAVHARHAKVVELRLFGGLTIQETAEALGVSKRSVDTDWALGRAWLQHDLFPDGTNL